MEKGNKPQNLEDSSDILRLPPPDFIWRKDDAKECNTSDVINFLKKASYGLEMDKIAQSNFKQYGKMEQITMCKKFWVKIKLILNLKRWWNMLILAYFLNKRFNKKTLL